MGPSQAAARKQGDEAGGALAADILRARYAVGAERDLDPSALATALRARVAGALAAVDPDPARCRALLDAELAAGRLVPGGRIWAAAGRAEGAATLINCFVQPLADRISGSGDGTPGIYDALREAAETMRRGGGVGYDFSSLRPEGAAVGGTGLAASGPVSFLRLFDTSCGVIESAGLRRGAQMAVLRADHPDIAAFVKCKAEPGSLRHFNISVGVTDAIMAAVHSGGQVDLVHPARPAGADGRTGRRRADGQWVYGRVDARELWRQIMRSTYEGAEPGVLFLDRINQENNLGYCEQIRATNPCGEIPLPAYGCCCLGAINLAQFVSRPFDAGAAFDHDGFARTVAVGVRLLDNALTATAWPLPQQAEEAMAKRRIGLGFTGLADALIMLGLRYDRPAGRRFAATLAQRMRDAAYRSSTALARERGAFPALDATAFLRSGFARRLPADIRTGIARHGIRNSHLLSVAPTGTISLAFAGNVASGLEPAFAWRYRRRTVTATDLPGEHVVENYAHARYRARFGPDAPLAPAFRRADQIAAEDHLAMQAAVQPYVCSAISKTVTVPSDCDFQAFSDLYTRAWALGLKGVTTYRPNAARGAVLSALDAEGAAPGAQAPGCTSCDTEGGA